MYIPFFASPPAAITGELEEAHDALSHPRLTGALLSHGAALKSKRARERTMAETPAVLN